MDGFKIPPPNDRRNSDAILSELAERAGRAIGRSIDAWLDCAAIIAQAREVALHGEWLPFLEHAGISERTARRMIRFAEAGIKTGTVADLGGIRETDEALALVEAWPEESREWWIEHAGIDGALKAALNYRFARDLWKQHVDDFKDEPEEHARIIQAVPDGPFGVAAWCRYGAAMADAYEDKPDRSPEERLEAMRAAGELAPWRMAA